MRNIFYVLLIASGFLFAYNLVRVFGHFSMQSKVKITNIIRDDSLPSKAYIDMIKNYDVKVSKYSIKTEHDKTVDFWIGILVTALAGLSAVISAFQAAQPKPSSSLIATRIVAVLAFCSTMTTVVQTHFNKLNTEDVAKITEIQTKKAQFIADCEKANANEAREILKHSGDLNNY